MAPKTVEPERIVEKSEALSRAAAALLPAGLARSALTTATVAREAEQPAPPAYLAVFAKAKGSVLIDIDGNEYIDYFGAHGALILGHADERVVAAVSKATSKGCAFGVPSEFEIRLAELIVGRFRSVEMVVL